MNIRLEQPKDYREVENLTRESFWNAYRPGCTEHYVLNQYRNNPDFIPELDFVMEMDGKIIGHVMFSKAEIILDDGTPYPSWTFGPISIHPDYKRKGYGLKLLRYALEKAKEMGVGLLQMEGNIEFYKHAGFDLASKMKIHYHAEPRESDVPYFLAQELIPDYWGNREGTYCPPKGYFVADENPDAFEAYEATFPQKEKSFREGQLPQFCQSCGMPLTRIEDCGTNADGSTNFDYCQYCYNDGRNNMETERIRLRPWQDSDAETLFKYASDPDVGPRAGWPPHKSVEESLEIIRTVFHSEGMWAVIWKESEEAIGCVGYLPASASNLKIANDECEVGYWIARPYWDKGICTEALKMVIDYCFNKKGFTTLWGDYFPSNPASGRVMEKCGFVDTGKETLCPNLEVGSDRPVKVMKLRNK
jgi:RimJ/RimL family protein N-acetyltransferase